jgi:glycosyltransferase involved in cell wall biosynthesis
MRVHVVASTGELGGAELALVTFLEHRPADVAAEASVIGSGPLAGALEAAGVPAAESHALSGRPSPLAAARFAAGLRTRLRAQRPDVVWLVGQKAAVLGAPAARLARVPAVWHKVDFTRDGLVARPLAALAGRVVAVSEAAAAAVPRRRVLGVVGPPIRLPADLRAAPDPATPAIGTLGRLVPYKGHDRILRAAALLSDAHPALRVVLAGSGAREHPGYEGELRALAAELGLGDRVELPGFADPAEVLGGLTVFVNATYVDEHGFGREALSGAMLEASWAGLPVVAVAGGGTAEGLVDGETGTLVADADPALLAAAIEPFLDNPALATRTGAAGAAFARERFAPGPAAERLFALLRPSARR